MYQAEKVRLVRHRHNARLLGFLSRVGRSIRGYMWGIHKSQVHKRPWPRSIDLSQSKMSILGADCGISGESRWLDYRDKMYRWTPRSHISEDTKGVQKGPKSTAFSFSLSQSYLADTVAVATYCPSRASKLLPNNHNKTLRQTGWKPL